MRAFGRSFGAVILGLFLSVLITVGFETLGNRLYPLPPGIDPRDREALKAFAAALPAGALLLVLAGWVVGAFCGTLVAGAVAGRARMAHAMIVALLLLATAVVNMAMLPHPVWMWVASVALLPLASYAAGRLATRN